MMDNELPFLFKGESITNVILHNNENSLTMYMSADDESPGRSKRFTAAKATYSANSLDYCYCDNCDFLDKHTKGAVTTRKCTLKGIVREFGFPTTMCGPRSRSDGKNIVWMYVVKPGQANTDTLPVNRPIEAAIALAQTVRELREEVKAVQEKLKSAEAQLSSMLKI